MKKLACMVAILFCCGQGALADEFKDVQCGSDIPKALIGQRSAPGRIVTIEGRNKRLGLKHLGADETSDQLSSINWLICGKEFILLEDRKNLIRDVLPFPVHSRQSPAFSGICQLDGREMSDILVGVLNRQGTADSLPVLAAWKIDLKRARFVKAPIEGVRCPKSLIFTVDGGL